MKKTAMRIFSGAAGLAIVFVLAWALPAAAQPPPAQPDAPPPPPVAIPPEEAIEVGDEELEMAAEAYMAIMELQQELQADLADVEDQQEIQQRIAQAQSQAAEAVSEAGLEMMEYEQIIRAIEQDDQLRTAFIRKIQP